MHACARGRQFAQDGPDRDFVAGSRKAGPHGIHELLWWIKIYCCKTCLHVVAPHESTFRRDRFSVIALNRWHIIRNSDFVQVGFLPRVPPLARERSRKCSQACCILLLQERSDTTQHVWQRDVRNQCLLRNKTGARERTQRGLVACRADPASIGLYPPSRENVGCKCIRALPRCGITARPSGTYGSLWVLLLEQSFDTRPVSNDCSKRTDFLQIRERISNLSATRTTSGRWRSAGLAW